MNRELFIEFVHAPLSPQVSEDQLCAAMLTFEERVLMPRGFVFHALLRNAASRYAHLVVAPAERAFAEVERDAKSVPEISALFACFELPQAKVFRHKLLGAVPTLPSAFGVLEHGTFRPKPDVGFSPAVLEAAAARVRDEYLAHEPSHLTQFMTDAGNGTYAEIVFGASLAHARRTCARYYEVPACAPLLGLCDPESVELDFWTPVLTRSFARAS